MFKNIKKFKLYLIVIRKLIQKLQKQKLRRLQVRRNVMNKEILQQKQLMKLKLSKREKNFALRIKKKNRFKKLKKLLKRKFYHNNKNNLQKQHHNHKNSLKIRNLLLALEERTTYHQILTSQKLIIKKKIPKIQTTNLKNPNKSPPKLIIHSYILSQRMSQVSLALLKKQIDHVSFILMKKLREITCQHPL